CEAGALRTERVEGAPPPGQLGARLVREDLLPAVVTLERWQVRRAREALRLVVEADASRGGRELLDERSRERGERADALREPVGDVGVVPAEELVAALARERDLDVLGGQPRHQVRRQGGRVRERLVEGCRERREQQRRVGVEDELAMPRA